jgi:hypothetical protein
VGKPKLILKLNQDGEPFILKLEPRPQSKFILTDDQELEQSSTQYLHAKLANCNRRSNTKLPKLEGKQMIMVVAPR